MSKQIVVALDGSEGAYEALTTAKGLAQAMGRDLALLYVYPHTPAVSATMSGLDQVTRDSLEELKKESGKEVFAEAESRLGSGQKVSERHLLWGDPAEEIIEFMESHPDTHLVMGRRGMSKMKRLVMGSVSDKVVRHAPGLVTVVS
ncbi:universal stress protein [Wenzhouxiangella sp. AB-CW3]|uniref:universal stress protein n=1 Tax=Wenzhouxiangella sp. AB-CW3 TaxID=2771012 RepID=UPI00168AE804|nr:universal stress protein [Wenzhouxiangella sp. AB-CW3]QOC24036.1 universal stress protein [Wenzhouxiangella sp. AB-CW3]